MIHLRIPGKPQTKQRARVGRNGGYTPKATADAEARIKQIAMAAGITQMEGPLTLICKFVYAPPKSWSKRKRQDAMGTWKTSTPDKDNLEKLVSDALNKIAYKDDAQIVASKVTKFWGQEDATFIRIEPAPERVPMEAV